MTLVNHDPGPSTTRSASRTASTAAAHAGAPAGSSRTERTRPGVAAIEDWPRICARAASDRPGRSGRPRRRGRAGPGSSAAPGRPRRPARPAAPAPRPGRRRRARAGRSASGCRPDGRPARPSPPSRCCSSSAHALVLGVVAGQRGQRHPQVARRQHVELVPDPARRPAVVGHGDDRGELGGDQPQRAQRRVQPVPAAQRDRALIWSPLTHGRDPGARRSACTPSRLSRSASSCAITTERCLPPVQPTARVR